MNQKLVVIEANEVPVKVFARYAKEYPESAVSSLLRDGDVLRTHANDVPVADLYPSQTWASFNTGVPFAQHHIHWYNDPKPPQYPMYWRAIANRGRSVGCVNTLHSSPLSTIRVSGDYPFLIPDCFAEDTQTAPSRYSGFQELNVRLTRSNARTSSLSSLAVGAGLRSLVSPSSYGVAYHSAKTICGTVAGIALGRLNKERLRSMQFPLLAEIFSNELKRTDVDLSLLFTNHVAASQHRYWYALFPEEFPEAAYPEDWVKRYRREILDAVALLDRYLARWLAYCRQTDRILIVCSSMGQAAEPRLTGEAVSKARHAFRLDDPATLLTRVLGTVPPFELKSSMVPQCSVSFPSRSHADEVREQLLHACGAALNLTAEVNGQVLTITSEPDPLVATVTVAGAEMTYEELGYVRLPIDDHRSGTHHPEGSLLVFNDEKGYFRSTLGAESDYLEYAPAVHGYFGAPHG